MATIYYFNNYQDALANQNSIGSSNAYMIGANFTPTILDDPFPENLFWGFIGDGSGPASDRTYFNESVDEGIGRTYYLYKIGVIVYKDKESAEALVVAGRVAYNPTDFSISGAISYVNENTTTDIPVETWLELGSIQFWKKSINGYGADTRNIVYSTNDAFTPGGGTYAIYPYVKRIIYYDSYQDALNETNSIGSSDSYAIGTDFIGEGGVTFPTNLYWVIAGSSPGAESQANIVYNPNDLLISGNNITYKLCPVKIVFKKADGPGFSDNVGYNIQNYTIASIIGPIVLDPNNTWIEDNQVTQWKIQATSNGSASQDDVYNNGNDLAAGGTYLLYPYVEVVPSSDKVIYFSSFDDAIYIQNIIGKSTNYTIGTDYIGATTPYPNLVKWGLAGNSNGTTSQSKFYDTGYTLDSTGEPTYYLYPVLVVYFGSENEASNPDTSLILGWNTTVYTVGTVTEGTVPTESDVKWRIHSSSTGSSPQDITYTLNDELTPGGTYILYQYFDPPAPIPCFLEGTQILCQVDGLDSYLPIENIKPGTLVKTSLSGYKKVEVIGKRIIKNPGNVERIEERLYKCSPENYPELKEDLFITGCHSILVDNITDAQREKTTKIQGRVFVTERKYRLMAILDERAVPWASEGEYTIWHLALEHTDLRMNYGVYAEGLLVETSSIRYMKNYSNMELIK